MRVLQCPICKCVRTEKELLPDIDVTEINMQNGKYYKYHLPDIYTMPQVGTVEVTCPECGNTTQWNNVKYKMTYKVNEMTNWDILDKAENDAKPYVEFPDNEDIYVGIKQGKVKYTKTIDGAEKTFERESGSLEILAEKDFEGRDVKKDYQGKAKYWALTDYWGMTPDDIKKAEKELSTMSKTLMRELQILDEEGTLYTHIIKIRKILGATTYQTKYRAVAVKPKSEVKPKGK